MAVTQGMQDFEGNNVWDQLKAPISAPLQVAPPHQWLKAEILLHFFSSVAFHLRRTQSVGDDSKFPQRIQLGRLQFVSCEEKAGAACRSSLDFYMEQAATGCVFNVEVVATVLATNILRLQPLPGDSGGGQQRQANTSSGGS